MIGMKIILKISKLIDWGAIWHFKLIKWTDIKENKFSLVRASI